MKLKLNTYNVDTYNTQVNIVFAERIRSFG